MIPSKLQPGDEVRVISPATSLAVIPLEQRRLATARYEGMGLRIAFSRHAEVQDQFGSSPLPGRVADIHDAFADPAVEGILTTLGGYNSNQLLAHLDYELIKANPKVLCGFSDITALSGAIYAKTGLVTYSGPHFSTLGMLKGADYTMTYFRRCVMESGPYDVPPAPTWSDDAWYADQEDRTFIPNEGYMVINEGEATGRLLGGNLCTFNLLQGTPYMPSLAGAILLIEDDYESAPLTFDRDLQSLCHQPDFEQVQGVIIGRFQKASQMDDDTLRTIIKNKRELAGIPVVAQANFGHTTPQFTFPIGGSGRLTAEGEQATFRIITH